MADLIDYLSEKYQPESQDEISRRLLELESLFEISQLLNESLELSRVLNNVLFIPMGRMMISRGAIILHVERASRVVMSKGLTEEQAALEFTTDELPSKYILIADADDAASNENITPESFGQRCGLRIAVPLVYDNEVLGLMYFGAKLSGAEFTEEEVNFLNSLATLSATTIANALKLEEIQTVNSKLDRKVHELKTLFDIGQGLSSTLDSNQILKLLVYALMGQMLITRYAILLKQESFLSVYDSKGLDQSVVDSIADKLVKSKVPATALRTADISPAGLRKLFERHELEIVIPMQHQDKLIGYVLLGKKIQSTAYTDTDLEFLTTLVSQAVISLENARLFEETLEKQRLEEELNVARNIQKGLLPKSIPSVNGYEIYGVNNSSKQVGGDYFDVIPIDEHRTVLAIGDVSGKGIPASLLMANLQSALRVMMTPDSDLADVVGRVNTLIHANTGLDKFITFFIGILDTRTHTFDYVNAGHNNPIHFANNDIKFLDIGGLILGIMPGYTYKVGSTSIKPGEFVLTYTDGVNEAVNPADEEFGEDSLYEIVHNHASADMKDLVENILTAIDDFSEGFPQADDVTMLAIRRLGN